MVLYVEINNSCPWYIHSWKGIKKPSDDKVNEVIDIMVRSMEVFYKNMPKFEGIDTIQEKV